MSRSPCSLGSAEYSVITFEREASSLSWCSTNTTTVMPVSCVPVEQRLLLLCMELYACMPVSYLVPGIINRPTNKSETIPKKGITNNSSNNHGKTPGHAVAQARLLLFLAALLLGTPPQEALCQVLRSIPPARGFRSQSELCWQRERSSSTSSTRMFIG